MTVGYEVYSYENTNGTETKTTISRNDYTYSYFNWYTLKDLYDYIANDPLIINADASSNPAITEFFASVYQARANYSNLTPVEPFFNTERLSFYNTKFNLTDRIIIHLTEQKSFGANDITGELHIHFNVADTKTNNENSDPTAVISDIITKTFTGFKKLDNQKVVNEVFTGFAKLTNKGANKYNGDDGANYFDRFNKKFIESTLDKTANTEHELVKFSSNSPIALMRENKTEKSNFEVLTKYDNYDSKDNYYFYFGDNFSNTINDENGIFKNTVGLFHLTQMVDKFTVNPTEIPKTEKYKYLYKGYFNFTATVYANDADNFSSTDTVKFEIILQSDI